MALQSLGGTDFDNHSHITQQYSPPRWYLVPFDACGGETTTRLDATTSIAPSKAKTYAWICLAERRYAPNSEIMYQAYLTCSVVIAHEHSVR